MFNKLGERKHDKYDKHDKSDKHDKHDKHDRSRDNSFIENDRKSVISNSKYDGKYDLIDEQIKTKKLKSDKLEKTEKSDNRSKSPWVKEYTDVKNTKEVIKLQDKKKKPSSTKKALMISTRGRDKSMSDINISDNEVAGQLKLKDKIKKKKKISSKKLITPVENNKEDNSFNNEKDVY